MNRSTFGKLFPIFLSVLWIFAVTFNYYIVHKPFGVENALAVLNALGDLFGAGALVALAAALGRRVLRGFQFDSPLDALVFRSGVGLGLCALATFLLGLVIVNRAVFWALVLLAAILLRDDLRGVWRDARALRLAISSRFERALAIFIAFTLAMACLVALTPPIAWDALMYHLVIPKLALEQGRITAPPDNVTLSYPALIEMLFLIAYALKGDIAAQLIHFGFLGLTLGALFAMATRMFNARVAWLAGAILLAVPSLVVVSTWAYVDVALAFYALVAFYALWLANEKDNWRWYALAGAFAGVAMGIKYSGVIVPFAIFALMLGSFFDRSDALVGGWAGRLRRIVVYGLCVALFAGPWYLRNLVFTGNPIYPFVFGGPYWDAFRAEWFSHPGSGLIRAPLQLLTAPWDVTILGRAGTTTFDATIGPLMLMLMPLLLLARPIACAKANRRALWWALIYAALLYAFWLIEIAQSNLLVQTRLLYPAFPIFALLAASALEGVESLELSRFSLQRFTRLVILLVMGLTVPSYAFGLVADNPLAYLMGLESREAYLMRQQGDYYAAMKFVNAELPPDARVFFLWEPRTYYAERSTQPDVILDAWLHLRWQFNDVDAIAAALCARGYTHVLLSRAGLDYVLQTEEAPLAVDEARAVEQFVARHFRQVYGKTPLQIVTRAGKPGVLNAAADGYAIYASVERAR